MTEELSVTIENIGGIDRASHTFKSGVTLITGPNASNKTSLLSALAFASGANEVHLRTAADEGRVTLAYGDVTVDRRAVRNGRDIERQGDPWADDEDALAFETFGCLLEFNPLRTAIRQGEGIEDLLKAPVDIDELECRRSEKLSTKQSYQRDLERLEDVETELAETESDLEAARERVEDFEAELATLYDRRDDGGETDKLQELRERQSDLATKRDRYREQVADFEDSIDEYEQQRADLKERIEDLKAELDEVDIDALRDERSDLRNRQAEIKGRIDILQSMLSTNREVIDASLTGVLDRKRSLAGDTITCWTCGQPTDENTVEETVETLSDRIAEGRERKREHEPRIEELDKQIDTYKERRQTLRDCRTERQEIERKLTDRRESLETKREQLTNVREELEEVESDLAERERAEASSDDLVEEIEETRVELQTARREVDRLESKLSELEERREERDRKREKVDRLTDEIATLSDRIETLESDLREGFNGAMDELLDVLAFERLERIWLDGSLDIVVAREVDDRIREDTVEHLSESEREMVGLVLGLAGYCVYDVAESVPVLLLDSVDAFDATRTERLLSFVESRMEFLLAAVLPETANEVEGFKRMTLPGEAVASD